MGCTPRHSVQANRAGIPQGHYIAAHDTGTADPSWLVALNYRGVLLRDQPAAPARDPCWRCGLVDSRRERGCASAPSECYLRGFSRGAYAAPLAAHISSSALLAARSGLADRL